MHDDLLLFGLIGWFVLLATAEALWPPKTKSIEGRGDRRLLTNFCLTTLVILLSSLVPLANLGASWASRRYGLGLGNSVAVPWLAVTALLLIAQTFVSYWVHRSMHCVPLLWRVHRVHHADTAVDVSTSLRNHPLELVITLPASALVVLLLGPPVSAVVAVQTVIFAATFWHHADIRLKSPVDRALAQVIVTPRVHRLHHHPERHTHDSNYGEVLILWDRLFRTFNDRKERGPVGLKGHAARADMLMDQIWSPLRAA